jgi:hypothetical protein
MASARQIRRRGHTATLIEQQAALVIEALETARQLAARQAHAKCLPKACRSLDPICPDCGKCPAAIPLREAPLHRSRQCGQNGIRSNQRARLGDVCRGVIGFARMGRAIDAESDHNGKTRLAFTLEQNSGRLGLPHKQIVGPFDI